MITPTPDLLHGSFGQLSTVFPVLLSVTSTTVTTPELEGDTNDVPCRWGRPVRGKTDLPTEVKSGVPSRRVVLVGSGSRDPETCYDKGDGPWEGKGTDWG